ncbi:MAG TPA: SDR family oxidoreductase [Bryobacteraceae bacterium]|nr:SDR family oxidoreductase [Bryobacteraceae bacterium]
MGALKNKVALITGGSRGIGLAIAGVFLREGAHVAICGRKQDALDQAGRELGPGVRAIACNVGRAADITALVETMTREFGRIDILVNNAGTNIAFGPALSFGEAQFDKMVDTNLKSAWRLTQSIAPGMCERGWGSIINIASISGLRPQHQSLLYSMTKAALIMMTQSYAVELAGAGVRVNAIAPGLIQTQMSEAFWKDEASRALLFGHQPIPRLGQPEDIAEVALLLASDRGSFITGQTLVVDGGRLLP